MEDSQRKFTVMGGRLKHDVCDYITAMTQESEVEVHVGCDSQNHKRHTVYVTTVVFRFPNNGAHVIYRRERVPKILDMWTKLWGETERSVDLANLILEECNLRVHQIDLDSTATVSTRATSWSARALATSLPLDSIQR